MLFLAKNKVVTIIGIIVSCGLIWFLLSLYGYGYYFNPDGILYFSYLRSAFFDKDLLFVNEFNNLKLLPASRYVTQTGLEGNHVAIGTPLLMAPLYGLVYGIAYTEQLLNPTDHFNGYYGLFTYVIPLGSLLFSLLTIAILWRLTQQNSPETPRVIALFHIFFGTPLFFYAIIHNQLAHASSAFMVTLFIFAGEIIRKSSKNEVHSFSFFLLGLVGGLACLVRTQNAVFWLIPCFYLVELMWRSKMIRVHLVPLFCYGLGVSIAVWPQLMTWKVLNGGYFAAVEASNLNLFAPHVWETLFSSYHGLFFWTPILILAVVGLIKYTTHFFWRGFPLLCVFFLQLWVNSSVHAWWEACSFGMRLFTNCTPIFAIGLIFLYSHIRKFWLYLVGSMFVIWTLLLCLNVIIRRVDLNIYYPENSLLAYQISLFGQFFQIAARHKIWSEFAQHYEHAFWLLLICILLISVAGAVMRLVVKSVSDHKLVTLFSLLFTILFLSLTLFIQHMGRNAQERKPIYHDQLVEIGKKTDNYNWYMLWSYHFYNALYLRQVGNYEQAVSECQKVIQLNPSLVDAYNTLGVLLTEIGRYQEALKIYQAGLAIEPQNKDLLHNMGLLKHMTKEPE